MSSTEPTTTTLQAESPPPYIVGESSEEDNRSIESLSSKSEEPAANVIINNELDTNKQTKKTLEMLDLPRQVHVHDPDVIREQLMQESNEDEYLSKDQNKEDDTTVTPAVPIDHTLHLPRIIDDEEKTLSHDQNIETLTNTIETVDNRNEKNAPFIQNESKVSCRVEYRHRNFCYYSHEINFI